MYKPRYGDLIVYVDSKGDPRIYRVGVAGHYLGDKPGWFSLCTVESNSGDFYMPEDVMDMIIDMVEKGILEHVWRKPCKHQFPFGIDVCTLCGDERSQGNVVVDIGTGHAMYHDVCIQCNNSMQLKCEPCKHSFIDENPCKHCGVHLDTYDKGRKALFGDLLVGELDTDPVCMNCEKPMDTKK